MRNALVAAMLLVFMTAVEDGVVIAQQGSKPDTAEKGTPAPDARGPASPTADDPGMARFIASLNDKTPLQVQVVVSRYKGDTRISSMPYVLSVNAVGSDQRLGSAEPSRLRMGAQVPVPTVAVTVADPVNLAPTPFNYQEIGTNIDCRARSMGDGRFEIGISVEDRSVFSDVETGVKGVGQLPVIRSFQSNHTLLLRDGQSRQFTAATDRVTGDVVRIDVSLTVVR